MNEIIFEPDEELTEQVSGPPREMNLYEKADYLINFIERLSQIETSHYDVMSEDLIKAINMTFSNLAIIQKKIKNEP